MKGRNSEDTHSILEAAPGWRQGLQQKPALFYQEWKDSSPQK